MNYWTKGIIKKILLFYTFIIFYIFTSINYWFTSILNKNPIKVKYINGVLFYYYYNTLFTFLLSTLINRSQKTKWWIFY